MPSFSNSFLKRAQTLDGDNWKEHLINPMLYFFLSGSEEKVPTGESTQGHPFAASEFRLSESLRTVGGSSACKTSDPKPDYLTIFGNKALPITNMDNWLVEPRSLVLNVETTTQTTSHAKYIAKKICIFANFVDAHISRADGTDSKSTIELLRCQTKGSGKNISYDKFQSIDDGTKADFKLIIATDWENKVLDWNDINTHIEESMGAKRVSMCTNGDINRGAWKVKTDTGCEFFVGQLDMSDIFDLAAVYDAAHGGGSTPRVKPETSEERELRYEFTDRMLWSITESSFGLNHANMAHHKLSEFSLPGELKSGFQHPKLSGGAGSIKSISELDKQKFDTGLECDMYQIRVPLSVLARMGRVERTIASRKGDENLQRNPKGNHCQKMAQDLVRGKRFHLPVFAFLPKGTDIDVDNQTMIYPAPESIPYQWLIVDGQHRMLARYFLKKGDLLPSQFQSLKENFTVDVIAYVPPDSANDAKIRQAQTEIFYQLNYLGLKPDANLKILHESHMSQRPSNWTWEDDMKTKPKMMVMKWFSHLNKALNDKNSNVFSDPVFDVQLTGQGMKISSIMTYLQKYFDFGVKFEINGGSIVPKSRKNKSLHPVVEFKKFGDTSVWGMAGCLPYIAKKGMQGPHPSECDDKLKMIADSFVFWLEELNVNTKPGGAPATDWAEGIFSWINLENAKAHYFAALFKIFVHDFGKEHTLHHSDLEVGNWLSTKIGTTPFGLTPALRSKIGEAICRNPNWQTTMGGQGQIKEIVEHILDGYNNDSSVIAAGSHLTIV